MFIDLENRLVIIPVQFFSSEISEILTDKSTWKLHYLRQQKGNKLFAKIIAPPLLWISLGDNPEFMEFINHLNQKYLIPRRKKNEQLIAAGLQFPAFFFRSHFLDRVCYELFYSSSRFFF